MVHNMNGIPSNISIVGIRCTTVVSSMCLYFSHLLIYDYFARRSTILNFIGISTKTNYFRNSHWKTIVPREVQDQDENGVPLLDVNDDPVMIMVDEEVDVVTQVPVYGQKLNGL